MQHKAHKTVQKEHRKKKAHMYVEEHRPKEARRGQEKNPMEKTEQEQTSLNF